MLDLLGRTNISLLREEIAHKKNALGQERVFWKIEIDLLVGFFLGRVVFRGSFFKFLDRLA